MPAYTTSRYSCKRRKSQLVHIGSVQVGAESPIAIQSMTTTPTQDVDATLNQCIRLAEAGCEIIRITAPNKQAARALKDIRKNFSLAGFTNIPLVADIHFLPQAAMEAAEHVEKVRINPGNYADKKRFNNRDYSDQEYQDEIERIHTAFSPIVLKCKELGRAMRIGTNHGSLSDRIMNRYGDTPLGMCESALEFLRIAEYHKFHNLIISMKASNPKVAIQAYRLITEKMAKENMHYPLHLGVTEAGDGDDARIKSAIGIGSLLYDGLGDTIRVSLTEDPVAEIPVAKELADKAHKLWESQRESKHKGQDQLDPYSFKRREVEQINISKRLKTGSLEVPKVILKSENIEQITSIIQTQKDAPIEGLLLEINELKEFKNKQKIFEELKESVPFFVIDSQLDISEELLSQLQNYNSILSVKISNKNSSELENFIDKIEKFSFKIALDIAADLLTEKLDLIKTISSEKLIFTLSSQSESIHPHGQYRALINTLDSIGILAPIWIRNTQNQRIQAIDTYENKLLDASILTGNLLCDGIGDLLSIETVKEEAKSLNLCYSILQGARARTTKTEYVACPSCGRTLFDLQETTAKIREVTGHLKGVTIAIMGCIVNGPGEMADADFGYVGGAPGKVNLYVGKEVQQYNIPEEQAVDKLIELIKNHGKWIEVDSGNS